MAEKKQTRRVVIEVKTTGEGEVKKAVNALTNLNRTTKEINKAMSGFGNTMKSLVATYLGAGAVGGFLRIADSMQLLRDRITVVDGDFEQAGRTMDRLAQIANDTRAPIESLTTNYIRLSQSVQGTGLSSESLLSITGMLQQTFLISGASAREAAASSIQLAQGLASGALRGEEFNSVMEQNVLLGNLLSVGLGKTRGELRKFAAEGGLTAKMVLGSLVNGYEILNGAMDKVRVTAEQGATVFMNQLSIGIGKLNEQIGITSGLGKSLVFLSRNMDILTAGVMALAVTAIPLLAGAFKKLAVAFGIAQSISPVFLLLGLLVAQITYITMNLDKASLAWHAFLSDGQAALSYVIKQLDTLINKFREFLGLTVKDDDTLGKLARDFEKRSKINNIISEMRRKDIAAREAQAKADYERMQKEIEGMKDFGKKNKEGTTKDILAELNREYLKGTMTLKEYYNTLDDGDVKMRMLTKDFSKGKMELIAYNEAQREIQKTNLNKLWTEGSIGAKQYNEELKKIQESAALEKLQAGRMTLSEYRAEMVKLDSGTISYWDKMSVGIDQYLSKMQNASQAIANMTEKILKGLEDQFVTFVMKGKASWEDFTNMILEELIRITYQLLIMKPLLDGFTSAMGGTPTDSYTPSATPSSGSSYLGVDTKLAKGGIVSSPTLFGYGRSKTGLMGEAGPEAVLPLRRGTNGDLGVQATTAPVYISINNNTGADVQTSESTGANGERFIELTIMNTVKKGMAQGAFDSTFSRNFNLQRKGV